MRLRRMKNYTNNKLFNSAAEFLALRFLLN
jgi:hypothetical protein